MATSSSSTQAAIQRFAMSKTGKDVAEAKLQAVPVKTEQATAWATKTWKEWASQRIPSLPPEDIIELQHELTNNIEKMTDSNINFWLPRFILEVCKVNGDEYPPNTLYQMICGIQRHLQKNRPCISLFGPTFADVNRTLDAEMKRLRATGLGVNIKKAEPITAEEEETLWEHGALGDADPVTLLNTLFYLIGVNFALRSGKEHRRLRHNPSQILLQDGDEPRLVYKEDISKTFQGGLKTRKVNPKVVTYYKRNDQPRRCLL